MNTYIAKAVRSGKWWAISVDGVSGAHTQARRIDKIEALAREAVALVLGVPEDSFDVVVRLEGLPHIAACAVAARQAAEAAEAEAEKAVNSAVVSLKGEGFSVRDIAAMLKLSPQRISQLSPR